MNKTGAFAQRYGLVFVASAMAFGLDLVLHGWVRDLSVLELIYIFPLAFSAWLGGLWFGLLAGVLAALSAISVDPRFIQNGFLHAFLFVLLGSLLGYLFDLRGRHPGSNLQSAFWSKVSPMGIFHADPSGACNYVNSRWSEITGLTPDQALGLGWAAALHADDRQRIFESWNAATKSGGTWRDEYRYQRPDLSVRWVLCESVPVRNQLGRIDGYVGYITDVTERRATEESQRQIEHQHNLMIEAARDGVFFIDCEGLFKSLNPGFEQITGLKCEAWLGKPFKDLVYEPDRAEVAAAFLAILEGEPSHPREIRVLGKAGVPIPVEVVAAPLKNGNVVEGISGIARDIRERKAAEATQRELARQRDRMMEYFQMILDRTPLGCVVLDDENRVTYWNPAAVEIFGFAAKAAEGRSLVELVIPPSEAGRVTALLEQEFTQSGAHAGPAVVDNLTRDGSRITCQWHSTRLTSQQGDHLGVVIMVQDITQRTRMERALAESASQLRTIFESEPECVHLLSVDSRVLQINPAGLALFEADRPEMVLGERIDEYIVAAHQPAFQQLVASVFRGEPHQLEYEVRGRRGTQRWLEMHAVPLRNSKGEVTALLGIARDVTERRAAEQALRESQANLAAAQQIARLGSWEIDLLARDARGANRLRWSDEVFRIFGFEPGAIEVSRETFLGLLHPVDRPLVLEASRVAMDERSRYSIDHRIIRPDGSVRFVHEQAEVITEPETGRALKLVGTVQDITERREAENALQAKSEELAALVSNSPLATFAMEAGGRITFWNNAASRLLGWEVMEVLTSADGFELLAPVGRGMLGLLRECLAGAVAQGVELVVRGKTGREMICSVSMAPVRDSHSQVSTVVVILLEVTERRRIEEALKESEARFRQLAENIQEVFWLATPDRKNFLYVSPAFESIFKLPTEQLYLDAATWVRAVHPADRPEVVRHQSEIILHQPYEEEYRIVRPDGKIRWIRDRAFAVLNEKNEVFRLAGLAEDVTRQKQIESQFLQAQKMESIGRLAGGVSHDFNNMLTAVVSFARLAMDEIEEGHPARADLQQVLSAADRATNVARQLLAFSRQQAFSPVVLDINDLLRNLQKMLSRLVREDVQLLLELGTGIGAVKADPGQLEQVVLNLVVNAVDAMPKGGVLRIRTTRVELESESSVLQSGMLPGWYARIAVEDTGTGMTEEIMERIFEPFFTTKGVGQGTGLGLATAFGIVRQSSGTMEARSQIGVGSEFAVYLPQVEDRPAAIAPRQVLSKLPTGSETILVVEDEAQIRSVAVKVLRSCGYTVLEAEDGEEALSLANPGHRIQLDLLVTDVVMPRMNGLRLFEELQRLRPGVKVLFISGYTGEIAEESLLQSSGQALLKKPFTPDILTRRVREILDAPAVEVA